MTGLGTGGPPDVIPTPPAISLSYDEIAEGELIGQGGNADVYRVTVQRSGRAIPVAVKQPRLQGTLDMDAVDRFVAEADVWESLSGHDHVVSLIDWGSEPLPWLAMEYMDRGTLDEVVAGDRLPLEQAVWVGLCVCRAVRHAHRHGVAHHDIKPANVLFRDVEGHWSVPKVSDWGLARLMLEETGSVEGLSPQYAAPEQFDADQYGSPDDRTDIYQVGTLVYELLTGEPPFSGSATAVMQGVLSEEPTPPSEVADVPAELDGIVLPALRKSKTERYDTVVYLRDQLKEFFESETESGDDIGATPVPEADTGTDSDQPDSSAQSGPESQTTHSTETETASESGDTQPGQEQRKAETTGTSVDESDNGRLSRRQTLGALGAVGVAATGSGAAWITLDPLAPEDGDISNDDISNSELTVDVTSGSVINESSNESLEFTIVNGLGKPVQEVEQVILEPVTARGDTVAFKLSDTEATGTVENFNEKTGATLLQNQNEGTYDIRPIDNTNVGFDRVEPVSVTITDSVS